MKVFLDTNIVIDFYQVRPTFFEPASKIMELGKKGEIELVVSATTFINAFYLLRKSYNVEQLYRKFDNLSAICLISPIDANIIKDSLNFRREDFEDSVQYVSAQTVNADVIITRNKKDYDGLNIKIQTPMEFLDEYFEKRNTHQSLKK